MFTIVDMPVSTVEEVTDDLDNVLDSNIATGIINELHVDNIVQAG